MRILYDISPLLDEKTAVWPGDTPLRRDWLCRIDHGSNFDLSTLTATVHLGAHADAPSHFEADGRGIAEVDLAPYLGPCRVITVDVATGLIRPDHFKLGPGKYPRVLFRTQVQLNRTEFKEDFPAFAPETIEALAARGTILIGIDTPSVDPFSSRDLLAHKTLTRHQMRNLESLDLSKVPDGDYLLIALPLRLAGFDASPVRAVLCELAKF